MGKPGAFLDIDRVTHELRPVEERSHDFDPLYVEPMTTHVAPRRAAA